MFGPYVTSYSLNTKSSQCHYVVRAFGFAAIEVIFKPKVASFWFLCYRGVKVQTSSSCGFSQRIANTIANGMGMNKILKRST